MLTLSNTYWCKTPPDDGVWAIVATIGGRVIQAPHFKSV